MRKLKSFLSLFVIVGIVGTFLPVARNLTFAADGIIVFEAENTAGTAASRDIQADRIACESDKHSAGFAILTAGRTISAGHYRIILFANLLENPSVLTDTVLGVDLYGDEGAGMVVKYQSSILRSQFKELNKFQPVVIEFTTTAKLTNAQIRIYFTKNASIEMDKIALLADNQFYTNIEAESLNTQLPSDSVIPEQGILASKGEIGQKLATYGWWGTIPVGKKKAIVYMKLIEGTGNPQNRFTVFELNATASGVRKGFFATDITESLFPELNKYYPIEVLMDVSVELTSVEPYIWHSIGSAGTAANCTFMIDRIEFTEENFNTLVSSSQENLEIDDSDRALKLSIQITGENGTNKSGWFSMDASKAGYVFSPGDKLVYDVAINKSFQGFGGVDLQENAQWAVMKDFIGETKDQNGLPAATSTDLSSVAVNKWYHREFTVPSKFTGKTVAHWWLGIDSNADLKGENIDVYIKNYRVLKSNGAFFTVSDGTNWEESQAIIQNFVGVSYIGSSIVYDPFTANEEIENALKITAKMTGENGMAKSGWFSIDNTKQYTLAAGDKIVYDVSISEPVSGIGGADLQTKDTWEIMNNFIGDTKDQNGLYARTSTDLSNVSLNKWYHREYLIPLQLSDKQVAHWWVSVNTNADIKGHNIDIYIKNYKVVKSDGSEFSIFNGANWNSSLAIAQSCIGMTYSAGEVVTDPNYLFPGIKDPKRPDGILAYDNYTVPLTVANVLFGSVRSGKIDNERIEFRTEEHETGVIKKLSQKIYMTSGPKVARFYVRTPTAITGTFKFFKVMVFKNLTPVKTVILTGDDLSNYINKSYVIEIPFAADENLPMEISASWLGTHDIIIDKIVFKNDESPDFATYNFNMETTGTGSSISLDAADIAGFNAIDMLEITGKNGVRIKIPTSIIQEWLKSSSSVLINLAGAQTNRINKLLSMAQNFKTKINNIGTFDLSVSIVSPDGNTALLTLPTYIDMQIPVPLPVLGDLDYGNKESIIYFMPETGRASVIAGNKSADGSFIHFSAKDTGTFYIGVSNFGTLTSYTVQNQYPNGDSSYLLYMLLLLFSAGSFYIFKRKRVNETRAQNRVD